MRHPANISAVVTVAMLAAMFASQATSQDFNGWCFDGGECTGKVEINGNSYDLCEESCQMKNPVSVTGLSATLYDVECTSDEGSPTSERKFFLQYLDQLTGTERGLMAGANGTVELFRCNSSAPLAASSSGFDIETMIQEFYGLEDRCRGGTGEAETTWEACGERNATAKLMNKLGYCLGTQDQAAFEYRWHACGPNSNYFPTE